VGGGYISCGDFEGDDKSGSALLGVVEDLQTLLRRESDSALGDLLAGMHAFVSGEAAPPDDWEDKIEITADQMAALLPYLKKCRDHLVENSGTSDPGKAMEAEQAASGSNSSELKWGKGTGWRLYCVTDLLGAAEHAMANQQSVFISFD
jgi:hypothetical protein